MTLHSNLVYSRGYITIKECRVIRFGYITIKVLLKI
uniref:Uncharacterized protein n=1 Tax=Arundo donax TaxID=35708 RepID=A0A0A9FUI7_ARUDO